jgi:hypothetical protein
MLKRLGSVLLLSAAGALLGYAIGTGWERYVQGNRPLLGALVGAAVGLFSLPLYRWWVSSVREMVVENVEIELPFVGGKLNLKMTDAQRAVGWRLFVESTTRVATQSMGPKEGIIREALTSLYKLFDIVRSELKSMAPTPVRRGRTGEYTVETYAVRMLNDGMRQLLSRWHPRLAAWEKTGRPESEWPLANECRQDLEQTRKIVLAYTWGLGEMVKVVDLASLLPEKPSGDKPTLVDLGIIQAKEAKDDSHLSDAQRVAGWHIFLELISRIATQPLDPQSGLMREALTSLNQLFGIIRTELKPLTPAPECASVEPGQVDNVETIALSILNTHLRPFLAKWHPRLAEWEKDHKTEVGWLEMNNCRSELEATRQALLAETRKLGALIQVKTSILPR